MDNIVDIKNRKNMLVIINPHSGHGKALNAWKIISLAVEKKNGIHCDVVETEASNHARQLVKAAKLQEYKAIITVSGDGTIFEVINGLYERPDWPVEIPLCIIPGGSGNGIHNSLLYQMGENFDHEMSVATSNIISGRSTPVDLIEVETNDERLVSMLGICWGMLAKSEVMAENLRWLPSTWPHIKSYLSFAWQIISLQEYHGSVSYLPLDMDSDGNPVSAPNTQYKMPNLTEPVPDDWITLMGPFLFVYICNQSWLDVSCLLCPSSRLDDGVIWLVVFKSGMTRRQLLDVVLNTNTARHIQYEEVVKMIPVRCYRIDPADGSHFLTVDAEYLENGPVQGQIRPKICPLLINKK